MAIHLITNRTWTSSQESKTGAVLFEAQLTRIRLVLQLQYAYMRLRPCGKIGVYCPYELRTQNSEYSNDVAAIC